MVGFSQQQFDQTLGVDPHSSSSFDQTSLVPCARIFCQLQANHVGFPQFDIHPVLRNIFKFRDNTTFLELWLKRKVFVVQEDFPMKRTIKTMDHDTIVTNSDYRQWQRYSLPFSTASVLASIMGWRWNIILNTYHDRLIMMVADLILSNNGW